MENLSYLLIVLTLLALCITAVRVAGQRRLKDGQLAMAERARRRRQRIQAKRQSEENAPIADHKLILQRELSKVPTPWGWPHHDESGVVAGKRGARPPQPRAPQDSLHRWIDGLLRQKQTVDNGDYRRRRDEALRALMEDRYGRQVKATEMPYRKVKPPHLRDPDAPHDQSDNFPSGKTGEIIAGIRRSQVSSGIRFKPPVRADLTRLKKPWGW